MIPIAPLYLWLVLQGGFLCNKLDKICDGYSQHNSCNTTIMYNIANILTTFCKVYLRLFPEINSKNIGY